MIATLLLDLLRHQLLEAEDARYEFRAIRPTFDINDFHVCGEQVRTTSLRSLGE